MANEVTFTTLSANGGRISSVLSALVAEQLYDPTDLRAVMTRYDWNAFGSDTMDITQDAVPGAFGAATSEILGGAANSAYTTSKFSLQVARYLRKYQMTDLFGITGGPIDSARVVRKLQEGVGLTMTDLLTALFPSLANNVGSSGVDLDVDDIYSAAFQLNNSAVQASEGLSAVLAPVQMNDFRTSLRAESGAIQYVAATAEALATKGPGFQGTWNGIDLWQSDSVTAVNAGADRNGAMFAPGCFAYTMAPVRAMQGMIPAGNVLLDAGELLVEASRDADNGMTAAIANLYPAVVEAEDLRGVGIISDA